MLALVPFLVLVFASAFNASPCNGSQASESNDGAVFIGTEFEQTSTVYVTKVTSIQKSCQKGNYEEVIESTTAISTHMTRISEIVESKDFNKESAIYYKETVASYIVNYSKIVETIVDNPGAKSSCHHSLKKIHGHLQTVINVYANFEISLAQAVSEEGGINQESLQKLDLQLQFYDNKEVDFDAEQRSSEEESKK